MSADWNQRESYYLYQYRILVYILFRDLDYVHFNPANRHVQITSMSTFSIDVGYRSYKIRKGLTELARLNLIYDVKFSYNKAQFYLGEPRLK